MAMLVGTKADAGGLEPLFLVGFAARPIRGVLYTLWADPYYLVSIQLLDGIGAGIFGKMRHIVLTSSFVALRPDATNASTRSNSTCRACPMPVTTAPTRNESNRGAVGKEFRGLKHIAPKRGPRVKRPANLEHAQKVAARLRDYATQYGSILTGC
jgi:hypothetical protein